ncbi:MAG: response regulator, partial [Bacteroidota bacterium]
DNVFGAPSSIATILRSLIDNAFFHANGGEITVQINKIDELPERHTIEVSIQDTGVGIEADKVGQMFKPFIKGKSQQAKEGMGLGLTIAKKLTEQIGGTLDLFSEVGVGTTAIVQFTLEPAKNPDIRSISPDLLDGIHILSVEDNPINRVVVERCLHKIGAKVSHAVDGLEAVSMAQANMYDLVLMDINMPNMNGLDATEAIRKLPGWSHIPIIALTATEIENPVQTLEKIGMQDIIRKPISLQGLSEKLAYHLQQTKPPAD